MTQQINLYNPAFERRRGGFGAAAMAQALAVLVLGCGLLVAFGASQLREMRAEAARGAANVTRAKTRLADVTRTYPARQPSAALQARVAEAAAQVEALTGIASVLERGGLGNSDGYADTFRAFARQRVEGVWLTSVTVRGSGEAIDVQGRAFGADLLPGYLAALTREPAMRGKRFGSFQVSEPAPAAGKPEEAAVTGTAPYIEFGLAAEATP